MRQPTPNPIMAHFQRARGLQKAGKPSEALKMYQELLKVTPNMPEARFQIARILIAKYRYDEALIHLKVARQLLPAKPEVWNQTLKSLRELKDKKIIGEIVREVQKGPLSDTSKAAIWLQLIPIFSMVGMNKEAFKFANIAEKFLGEDVRPTLARSRAYLDAGQFDDAVGESYKALEKDPTSIGAFANIVRTKKLEPNDPLPEKMAEHLKTLRPDSPQLPALHFALGKHWDDQKDYDQAFEHYLVANKTKRALYPYDRDGEQSVLDRIHETLETFNFEELKKFGNTSDKPIFITGSPRSGTSLVQQILSRHKDVATAGEAPWFHRARHLRQEEAQANASSIPANLQAELNEVAQGYLDQVNRQFPNAKRVTDKAISTYRYLGLLAATLPNAPVIILRRDPRDNAISCFRNSFREGTHRYTNSLEDLGKHFVDFRKVVEHWTTKLPNRFLEVDYSELTKDPEPQAKRILDYCGLEWDPSVLTPGKSEYQVRTLSIVQARQPINTKSVASWKRYEKHLGPLFDALEGD